MIKERTIFLGSIYFIFIVCCPSMAFADAVAQDYMSDMEPLGSIVSKEDFYFPYLVTVIITAFVTFYLGSRGLFNLPRKWIRKYYKCIGSEEYTSWLINKLVSLVPWLVAFFPVLIYIWCLLEVTKIESVALSAALEGFMLAFAAVLVVSDEILVNFRTILKKKKAP